MGWYENRTEMARYVAELKQLLGATALSLVRAPGPLPRSLKPTQ